MGASVTVRTIGELEELRAKLRASADHACRAIAEALRDGNPLRRLKFERLGCDPLDAGDAQNIAEQIDQQATYEVALDALAWLMARHPDKHWELAPGAHGAGHDITSSDGVVAAEIFAAVSPSNNDKLKKDIAKVSRFSGGARYVFYRSPGHAHHQRSADDVVIVSLGLE
jgi:phosphatidylserine decarboxylase